ncbi:hypothetical protein Tco_1366289 [Tanacetum coccineum]
MSIILSLLIIIISSITCNNNSDGDHFKGAVFNVNYKFYGRKKVLLDDLKAFDSIVTFIDFAASSSVERDVMISGNKARRV